MSEPRELQDAPTMPDADAEPTGPLPARSVLPSGSTIGQYVLLDVIGAGGMGIVYAARDPKLDRRVAIKLLRPDVSSDGIRGRSLLREAKAMARLSHPNVCTVYEVGRVGDRVFIAMEYVDGVTMTRWLGAAPRTWRDIVAVMVHAGRGLEAAHRAGIIHRDFKPDNVMIGSDARVRVMDFGLAGQVSDASAAAGLPRADSQAELDDTQTVVEALIGTPAYMAPEQLRAQRTDARSDQFSFCVAFYQALYGERPYPGATLAALIDALDRGRVRDAPAKSRVPRWLRKILLRGLAVDPDQRYPSMAHLVDDILRVQRRRRLHLGVAAALALVAAGTALGVSFYQQPTAGPTPCAGAGEHLAEVWNSDHRRAIDRAITDSGLSYAKHQSQRVIDIVDRYARRWEAMHRDACEATRIRGEQSEDMLDRRMLCLDHRRQELGALVSLLSETDIDVARNAAQAALTLDDIDRCAARESLLMAAAPPRDPAVAEQVARIRERLADVEVRLDSGKYQDALTAAGELAERARATGYAPVEAEALYLLGMARGRVGELAGSEDALLRAALLADVIRDDFLRAQTLAELVNYVGYERGDYHAGRVWAQLAGAALERAGGDARLEAQLLRSKGNLSFGQGDPQASHQHHARALAIRERVLEPDHPDVIESLTAVGAAAQVLRQYDEAVALLQRALDTARRSLGPEHPVVADALNNLGNAYAEQGHLDLAHEHYVQASDIWEAALGPGHTSVAIALTNLGALALADGDPDQAIALYQRALDIEEAALGPGHLHIAVTLSNLGIAYLSRGEPESALEHLERSRSIFGAAENADAAQTDFALARALWVTGQRSRARDLAAQARETLAGLGDRFTAERDEIERWLAAPE